MKRPIRLQLTSAVLGALACVLVFATLSMQQVIGANRLLSAAAVEFLNHLTMENLPDGQGGVVRTARISRLNLQIVDGTGTTNGAPTGLGNLIVGYNEQIPARSSDATVREAA